VALAALILGKRKWATPILELIRVESTELLAEPRFGNIGLVVGDWVNAIPQRIGGGFFKERL
jgi:hypothetical protein